MSEIITNTHQQGYAGFIIYDAEDRISGNSSAQQQINRIIDANRYNTQAIPVIYIGSSHPYWLNGDVKYIPSNGHFSQAFASILRQHMPCK